MNKWAGGVTMNGRLYALLLSCLFLVSHAHVVFAESRVPVILVPGWGPPAIENWDDYVSFLVQDGHLPQDIYVTSYSFLDDVGTIREQLDLQFRQILSWYPSSVSFDVITHSMGQFVGLYTIMEGNFNSRVRKFVGISGIAHGMDPEVCIFNICGHAMDRSLTPFLSNFLTAFFSTFRTHLDKLDKCSIYSPQDGVIEPYDSGKFADGTNASIEGMHHLKSIHEYPFYRAMTQTCYGR
jgi:pimeloyl-ACP methyl ester carboxylesterase